MENYAGQAKPISVFEYPSRYICGTVAVAGPTTLIAAPGLNRQIMVTSFVIQNESQTATTITLRDGTHDRWRVLGQNQGDGLAITFPSNHPFDLRANQALIINLSGANQCGYSIQYHIADV